MDASKFTAEDAKFADKTAKKIKDVALKLASKEGQADQADSPFWILTAGVGMVALLFARLEGNVKLPLERKFYDQAMSRIKSIAATIAAENNDMPSPESAFWLLLAATSLVATCLAQLEQAGIRYDEMPG
jgi:hypothetical protein